MKWKVLLIEHRSHLLVPADWTRDQVLSFLKFGSLDGGQCKMLKDVGSEVVADISNLYPEQERRTS